MLQSFNTGGFAMTFENGLTIKIGFSTFHYGSNRNKTKPQRDKAGIFAHSAEVSIWEGDSDYYRFQLDDSPVQTYVNADGVAEWIKAVQKATSLKDIVEPENV